EVGAIADKPGWRFGDALLDAAGRCRREIIEPRHCLTEIDGSPGGNIAASGKSVDIDSTLGVLCCRKLCCTQRFNEAPRLLDLDIKPPTPPRPVQYFKVSSVPNGLVTHDDDPSAISRANLVRMPLEHRQGLQLGPRHWLFNDQLLWQAL